MFGFTASEINSAVEGRAIAHANYRLDGIPSFAREGESREITVEVTNSAFGRRHVSVTIISSFTVPFGEVLGFIGMDGFLHYEVVGRAEGIDLSNYLNTVGFVDIWTTRLDDSSRLIGAINSFIRLFHNLS